MATHSIISRPFPRGYTAAGKEVVILTWRDLESLSQVHVQGGTYRTYCPIHGSDHQRSLSITARNGWGHCFSCGETVFVADCNPATAARLQERRDDSVPVSRPTLKPLPARANTPRAHSKPPLSRADWQAEECRLLTTLQAQGALRLDRDVAWNAQAYLEARHIPVELALSTGVGYLEPGANVVHGNRFLQRWEDRVLFPLAAYSELPNTLVNGFAGRLIAHWQSCPDETAHKQFLEQKGLKRWIKTNPAGWFWEPQRLPVSDPVVVVEGPFDRLAILAEGRFQAEEVIALVGTALQSDWLSTAQAVLLALDSDQGGREATTRIMQHLASNQVPVDACQAPADDKSGKDWSERWRRRGSQGLDALYAYHALLAHGA